MARHLQGLKIELSGLVQGVGMRWWLVNLAKQYNLFGWVKNEPSGTVTVLAEGEIKNLNDFLIQIKESSAPGRIDKVAAVWASASGQFQDFVIKP